MQATGLENNPDTERIARLIREHAALVAEGDGTAVGFVDAFQTISADGTMRWEIDLLGVDPAWQGRGFARQLIRVSVREGAARGVGYARALIRTDNHASQRTFAACDFVPSTALLLLYVAEPANDAAPAVPQGAHLVEVETFTYSGVWLEWLLSLEAFQAARVRMIQMNGSTAGALIARDNSAAIAAAEQAGYVCVGAFNWWERSTAGAV